MFECFLKILLQEAAYTLKKNLAFCRTWRQRQDSRKTWGLIKQYSLIQNYLNDYVVVLLNRIVLFKVVFGEGSLLTLVFSKGMLILLWWLHVLKDYYFILQI